MRNLIASLLVSLALILCAAFIIAAPAGAEEVCFELTDSSGQESTGEVVCQDIGEPVTIEAPAPEPTPEPTPQPVMGDSSGDPAPTTTTTVVVTTTLPEAPLLVVTG